ncbi:MAG: signal recognition particle-docking protein FtsY [Alphaproteobacteria bacterium]|nr:signal recognition particle-docking protein FtsY [Alphaproteobacteria bacterium]
MSWIARLKAGLSKTSHRVSDGISGIFQRRRLDEEALEQLESLLIEADMGASVAASLVAGLAKQKFGKEVTEQEVKAALAAEIAAILSPVAAPLDVEGYQPFVVMMVGVNGNGKTTTAGKLAMKWKAEGKRVTLAAGDTFRAAAVEQLQEWARRARAELVTGEPHADPASVAYRALERARAEGADVLLIDTAGRLHNKANLMAELQKITAVLKKLDASAPHAVIQVLDATTGQNAIAQVEAFRQMIGVTGLIVTKLDGTAKGGVVVALASRFGLKLHAIGVGEGMEDLDTFTADAFTSMLLRS